MTQTAFVTGGSGFLGRQLIRALLARGWRVRALARPRAVAAVRAAGAEPVPGDLDDSGTLAAGLAGADVAFHAAALVGLWGPLAAFHRTNVAGTAHVLAAARAAGVPRLVHVSTEAVLLGAGARPIVDADETHPRPRRPLGPYARTKGLAEARVLAANAPGLATVVVRPRLVWGAGDRTFLPQLAVLVRRGQFRWVDGGRYPTSTCHVANAAYGLLLAAERGQPGAVYFVTDGPPVEFRAFAAALLRSAGLDPGERSLPRRLALPAAGAGELLWRALRLPGQPPLTRAAVGLFGQACTVSDARARRELGYAPPVSREAGLAALASDAGCVPKHRGHAG